MGNRTPQFSVSWEEFIDNLIEENRKLNSDVSVYKSQRYAYKKKYLALLEANTELDAENQKLKEKIKRLEFDVDAWYQLKLLLEWEIEKLREENENWREEKRAMEITLDSLGYWERKY